MSAAARTPAPGETLPRTLYLVRHAIAAARGDKFPDDGTRPLTQKGATRMRRAARGLASLRPDIDLVLTSPLVRAQRTAEILAAALVPSPRLEVLDELAPGHTPAEVAEALGRYAARKTIALVGHEPDLGALAAWLIGAREPLPFKKGGVACLEVAAFPPARTGRLRWFAPPMMLRALR